MKYLILLAFFLSSCAPTWYCAKWETVPSGRDCIEWEQHPLSAVESDVCMGTKMCARCIERTSSISFEYAPQNACRDLVD